MNQDGKWQWRWNWRTGITYGPVPVGLIVVGAVLVAMLLWVPTRFG